MQLLTLPLLLSALPLALGQYGDSSADKSSSSSSAPASTTASSSGSVHTVAVGNGGLTFTPDSITAAKGETVEFHFYPPTHSVAQASFDSPCTPSANGTGFFSGGFTTSSGTNANVFTLTINETTPIWFYCGFPTHCESGMVGVINPPAAGSPNTLDAFKSAAANVGTTVAPTVVQGGVIGPAKAASSSGSSTSASTSATSKPNAGNDLRGNVAWVGLVSTVVVAWGFGTLMI
ncbi:hypothetical protein B7494_g829 [Chlorociboria aeruginascens]|nr:hypothetical protein B7494_g829 [Chlorociboria aeruginascens]